MPVRRQRPGGARQSALGQRLRGKSNAANKARPGVGIGKAAASKYVSPNISAPTSASYGAYDSGSTLEKIARNEWLNTLDPATRARAMNKMGYWTGGVPTRPDQLSKREIAYYKRSMRDLQPGEMYQPQGANGAFLGTFTKGAGGKILFDPLGGKGKGKRGKGNGRGSGGASSGGGRGGTQRVGPPIVGPPVPPTASGPPGGGFTTGVSGATGQFITEKGGQGPAGEEAETRTTKKRKKGRNKKLVKRVVKKTDVKGKAVRRALRSPGVTASDRKVYARVAKTNPKLSARLRARDRKKK